MNNKNLFQFTSAILENLFSNPLFIPISENQIENLVHYSLKVPYCSPAWDSFYCWPPTNAGAVVSQLCSSIFSLFQEDLVAEIETGARAYRVCTEDGEWLWGNWTNYTECLPLLEPDNLIPLAVGYILLICSSLSLLTLSVTLFVFWYFTSLHCTRLKVHRNLVASMIINAIVLIIVASYLLFGEHVPLKYEHDLLCRGMLSLKMYTSMSSINWMFIEGLVLHSRITISIFKQDAPFKLYYFIGWGLPVSITIIWSSLMCQELPTPCWLGYGNSPYIWVIVGPMLAALIVNTLFLVNILRILVTRNKANANASEETTQVKKAVKATGLLFPLLGITNLMFCINPRDKSYLEDAYMIINALLQSSQGILVSVLYCFANSDVQKVLRKSYHKRVTKRNSLFHPPRSRGLSQTSTTYLGHSDVHMELTKKFVVCGKPVLVPLRDCVIPPNKTDITTHVF